MRRRSVVLPVAGALAVAVVAGTVVAEAAPAAKPIKKHTVATYQMFANVDAEGDLGSNYDATKVTLSSTNYYVVSFKYKIGSCAAQVQAGKAGGIDSVPLAIGRVQNQGDTKTTKKFLVGFSDLKDNFVREPFMITVTCHF